MSDNYKGQLQALCAKQGFQPPTYHTTRDGKPHSPAWVVTVSYGENTYVVPSAIPGTKKRAEQVAARQVLERMGEIVKTLKSEAEIIDTLFFAYDLLKDRPFLHPKGIADALGIREKAARRYKENMSPNLGHEPQRRRDS